MNMARDGSGYRIWIICSVGFYILFSLVNVLYGRIHVDEGFYFVTPYLVYQGQIPYRDFIYTQAPLHSYIYSLMYQVILRPDFVVMRIISFLFGLGAVLLGMDISRRKSGWVAAALATGLLCYNGFLSYFFSMNKLYPLTAFLFTLGVWTIVVGGQRWTNYLLGSIFLSLATCVRISVFPALAILLIWVVIRHGVVSRLFWAVFFGVTVVTSSILGPFLVHYFEQFVYSVFLYNFHKDVHPLWMTIMLRFDVICKMAHEFFLFLAMLITLIVGTVYLIVQHHVRDVTTGVALIRRIDGERWLLLLILAGVSSFQAVSKSGVVDEYLTPFFPLAASLIAIEINNLYRALFGQVIRTWAFVIFMMLCLLNLAAYGRTSLSLTAGKSPTSYLQEAASYIQSQTRPGDEILSYNNALVVLADRRIVPGYEMHVATNDPNWDEERCRRFRIVTQKQLESRLQNQEIALVAIAENSFIGRFPEFYNPNEPQMRDTFLTILESNYVRIKQYPELGYFNSNVDIYLARSRYNSGSRQHE
ncbi:hypothetical protein JXQ70_12755 [bacterium]|nr:hypothetical protein [bacterium]